MKNKLLSYIGLAFVLSMVLLCSCNEPNLISIELDKSYSNDFNGGLFRPIVYPINLNKAKISLGRMLFEDKKLSADNTISCTSCHNLTLGGDDGRFVSEGVKNSLGGISSPAVYNSVNNFRQFWDGRAENLFDQVDGPINNKKEHGSSWAEIVPKLNSDEEYVMLFKELFDEGITQNNIKICIVEFEKSLVTPSAFDRFLLGDSLAIDDKSKEGLALFVCPVTKGLI